MKKLNSYLLITFCGFLFSAGIASAQVPSGNTEQVNSFDASYTIHQDSSVDVVEGIEYDFGPDLHHGIFRYIPVFYSNNSINRTIRISDVVVTDKTGRPYKFTQSKQGDNLYLKIGDPDVTISGVHFYVIQYKVRGAINYFSDHDEFYWNVTGNGWNVPIAKASAIVTYPDYAGNSFTGFECYVGEAGSNAVCSSKAKDDAQKIGTVRFIQADQLLPGEGLTIVVGTPKGILREPTLIEGIISFFQDNIRYLIAGLFPIFALVVMFYLWYTRGRDPKGRATIIPEYEAPDKLSPSQVGGLADEHVEGHELSAEIVGLAIAGFLKINRIESEGFIKMADYELVKLKNADGSLNGIQIMLMGKLFAEGATTVKISDLKEKFYKDFLEIKDAIYNTLVDGGYFPKSPAKVRGIYVSAAFACFAIGFFIGGPFIVSGIICALIVGLFSFIMPVKTVKGVLAEQSIEGLKLYLTVAEKARIEFHNAPEKNPQQFEKLLPFAMALKVEEQWAKQFKDIYLTPPQWYGGAQNAGFNALILTNNLNNFSAAADKNLVASPAAKGSSGFGGGGFSGGGFGGGGGGSW